MMIGRGLRGTYMDIPTEDIERLRREAFFASLQDGFELLGADGTILEVNDRFAEIVGRPREEIVGLRPPFPWWPAEGPQRDAVQAALRDVAGGGSGEFDLTFRRPDGRSVDVIMNANAVPAPGGGTIGVVAIMKDVSDRVVAHAEREELLASLAKERTRLAAALQRLSRLQRFTASISPRMTRGRGDRVPPFGGAGCGRRLRRRRASERDGVLERVGASGEFDPEMVPEATPVEDEGSLAEAFRTAGSLWMEPRPGWKDKEARERWAFVPLVGRGGPMGVLALCCPEDGVRRGGSEPAGDDGVAGGAGPGARASGGERGARAGSAGARPCGQ